jgi:hypothetical protein
MSRTSDATHDPALRSWVEVDPASHFPIQNLPFGIFRRKGSSEAFRGGVAIGDRIVDLAAWSTLGAFEGEAAKAAAACAGDSLNPLLALGRPAWGALRQALSGLLKAGAQRPGLAEALVPMDAAEMGMPVRPANYTDFFCSLEHAMNAGKVMRNDASVNPNFRWVPIAYHGRASSLRVSGTPCRRPMGQAQATAVQSFPGRAWLQRILRCPCGRTPWQSRLADRFAEADDCVAHDVSPILLAPGSDLRHASIDGEIHAGDVRTFIGGEERDRSRDFLWLAPATHRDLRRQTGRPLARLAQGKARRCRQGRGLDCSGAHQFTRILRSFSSSVQARAKLRTAALLAA